MTYSIIARDPDTGQLGIGVQSHYFAVGASVPFAEYGVGAVATQASAHPEHRAQALDLVRSGSSPAEALECVLSANPQRSRTQVAIMSASGETATYTGEDCVGLAGHVSDEGISCQANMVEAEVWLTMRDTFAAAEGDLAVRLLAALHAAEAHGGDRRGRQSAALIVTSGSAARTLEVDLRVDDHPDPLGELARLDQHRRAASLMLSALDRSRRNQLDQSVAELKRAQALYGDANLEPSVWAATLLARVGRLDEAHDLMRRAVATHSGWAGFVAALPSARLLPDDPALIDALLAERG